MKEPPYVKLYIDDITKVLNLPPQSSPLLYELLRLMNFSGTVVIVKSVRERIGNKLGISDKSIRNRLSQLVKAGVMLRVGGRYGEYQMNPSLFARGDWSDVRQQREEFELKIRYRKSGDRVLTGQGVDEVIERSKFPPISLQTELIASEAH